MSKSLLHLLDFIEAGATKEDLDDAVVIANQMQNNGKLTVDTYNKLIKYLNVKREELDK